MEYNFLLKYKEMCQIYEKEILISLLIDYENLHALYLKIRVF